MIRLEMIMVREGQVGLLYEDGRYVRTFGPRRVFLASFPWRRREIRRVDVRRESLLVNGQEMLTADALSVRLNVAAEFRVVDAATAIHTVVDFRSALYTALQLILRDEVQSRTLEQLLADRNALSGALADRGRPEAEALGLELLLAGVKDIILPGEVKRMLSQELDAQRSGRAALVAAREEVAATRAKANTAQLIASHPVLLRLREIEALGKMAEGTGNTLVVAMPGEIHGVAAGGVVVKTGE